MAYTSGYSEERASSIGEASASAFHGSLQQAQACGGALAAEEHLDPLPDEARDEGLDEYLVGALGVSELHRPLRGQPEDGNDRLLDGRECPNARAHGDAVLHGEEGIEDDDVELADGERGPWPRCRRRPPRPPPHARGAPCGGASASPHPTWPRATWPAAIAVCAEAGSRLVVMRLPVRPAGAGPEDQAPADDALAAAPLERQPLPAAPAERTSAPVPGARVHRRALHRHRDLPGAAWHDSRPQSGSRPSTRTSCASSASGT